MAELNYESERLTEMRAEAESRTEVAYPLNDTPYIAEDAQLWHSTRTQGVYSSDTHLTTRAAGGMQVAISAGIAWIKAGEFENCVYGNKEEKTFTIDTADGRLPRIDRVTIRWDKITNTVTTTIKKGTPAINPQPPTLARNAEAYELGIANIRVPAGTLAVTQSNIQDTRLDEYACGIMRDGVTGIPTQALVYQWTAWYNSFTDKAGNSVSEKLAQFEKSLNEATASAQKAKDEFANLIDTLTDTSNTTFKDFASRLDKMLLEFNTTWEEWLAENQDKLNEYPAGEWMDKIDKVLSKTPTREILSLQFDPKTKADIIILEIVGGITNPLEKWGFYPTELVDFCHEKRLEYHSGKMKIIAPQEFYAVDWEVEEYATNTYIASSLDANKGLMIYTGGLING